jgi:hypothetical protein
LSVCSSTRSADGSDPAKLAGTRISNSSSGGKVLVYVSIVARRSQIPAATMSATPASTATSRPSAGASRIGP